MPRPAVTTLRPALLTAALLALAACGGDAVSPSAISDTDVSMDVAAQTGDAIAADVSALGDAETVAGLAGAGAPGCAIVNGRHRCASVTSSGVTTTRSYAYYDASGATMAAYDAALTASLDVQTDIVGSATGTTPNGTFAAKFARSRAETLSGLAGTETRRTWNGVATSHDTTVVTATNETRTYAGASADTTTNVVVALPRSSNPYPISGQRVRSVTATMSATGRREETRQVTRRAVVTFNGTATVPLTVNGVACTLHLDTHRVDGCAKS